MLSLETNVMSPHYVVYNLVKPKYIDWEFYRPYLTKEPPFSQIGLAVYLRTYSRYIPEVNRREKWCETVLRVVEHSLSLDEKTFYTEKEKEAKELFNAIFNLRVFPAGRALWIGGTEAVKRSPSAVFNCSYSNIDSLSAIVEGFYLLLVGAGFGFSIQEEYVSKLPKLNKDLEVYHYPYRMWKKGFSDTSVWLCRSEKDISLAANFIELDDIVFDDYLDSQLKRDDREFVLTVGDSKEGWCTALKFLLWAYSKDFDRVSIDYSCVRPKGTPLKTFGGRASGHEALQEFFERIHAIVNESEECSPQSTQVLDICNAMGAAVVVGGVRRSSEIALGDMNDTAFIEAKKDLWSDPDKADKTAYRTMSNNSVMLYGNPGLDWFEKTMESVKTNGEPGFVSIGNANKRLLERCKKFKLEFFERKGTNPCLSADTWIHTQHGARQIKDLIALQTSVFVDGVLYCTDHRGFYKTGTQFVFTLQTAEGYSVDLTANHKVKTQRGWVESQDLRTGDLIKLHDHTKIKEWHSFGTFQEGYLIGKSIDNMKLIEEIESGSKAFLSGIMQGLYDSKGRNVKPGYFNPQSKSCDVIELLPLPLSFVQAIQRIALRLGIKSIIKNNCLIIEKVKGNYENLLPVEDNPDYFNATFIGLKYKGIEDVYDCTVPSVSQFDANGFVVHNCSEIMLDSKGVCNLSEVNVDAHIIDSKIDWELLEKSVRLATRVGSRMTLIKMFHPEWDRVQKRDRLLGVSLTGIMTAFDRLGIEPTDVAPMVNCTVGEYFFKYLQEVVDKESFSYHDKLGIPRPLLATCIKPSGTLSLLPGVSPGIHRDYAPYYLRRVRVSNADPIAHALRSLGVPCCPENGQSGDLDGDQCKTWVFTFPVKTNAPIRSIDESAISQLERYKLSMKHWTQHSTSVTISVDENEWNIVADWLYKNYDDFVGVSFLPKFDSHNSPYPQLPMESCDKETYELLASTMPQLTEDEFINLIASKETFYEDYELDSGCSSGACPVR